MKVRTSHVYVPPKAVCEAEKSGGLTEAHDFASECMLSKTNMRSRSISPYRNEKRRPAHPCS